MSYQIVECPGCLTRLRVRESQSVIRLQCPRCGEQLEVDPLPPTPVTPEPRSHAGRNTEPPQRPAPPPPRAATGGKAATPGSGSRSQPAPDSSRTRGERQGSSPPRRPAAPAPAETDDSWNQSWDDSEPTGDDPFLPPARHSQRNAPARTTGRTILLAGAAGGLIGLILLAVSVFSRGGSTSTGLKTTGPDEASMIASAGNPDVASSTLSPSISAPSGSAAVAAAPDAGSGVFGAGAPPAGINSAEAQKVRYQWKPGSEYQYEFTIEEGSGENATVTRGSCSYSVGGDASAVAADEVSSGTGFVVGADGLIATCAHVIEGARQIEVSLGGQSYPGQVVCVDPRADVALVRIAATGLPVLPLADSDTVQLAEDVRVIGFPLSDVLGTDVKITTGTIAGIVQDKTRGRRLQVDAPINPGNSGGPVVNGAGQVIGVASAKLSGASVTAVGFASPVNQLRALAAASGISLPAAPAGSQLAGPEIARRAMPSVAYMKVSGSSAGRTVQLTYTALFSQSTVPSVSAGFPRMPFRPTQTRDEGTLTVNSLGEILEFDGTEQLPAVLGPVGVFFLERLDPYSESKWQFESESTLQRINRNDGPFGGRLRGFGPPRIDGPRGFGPPGFGPPGFGQPQDEVVEEIPAIERVTYQFSQSLNNKVAFDKSYEFTATRANGQLYMVIRGRGTMVFDIVQSMPSSLEYQATIEQTGDDGTTRIPVKVSYTLRNPEEVRREREQWQQQLAAQEAQAERDRTVPNPQLIDELLTAVRSAKGGHEASAPLGRLGKVAIVEERRDDVLQVARDHMKNSSDFVRKSATEALCHWAGPRDLDDVKAVLADPNGLLHDAKQIAVRTLARIGGEKYWPDLVLAMSDFLIRDSLREVLIAAGPPVEKTIMENFDKLSDISAKRELLEVLKNVGTAACLPFLEKHATGTDGSLRFVARDALDAVRSRL